MRIEVRSVRRLVNREACVDVRFWSGGCCCEDEFMEVADGVRARVGVVWVAMS